MSMIEARFSLVDDHGHSVTEIDFRGAFALVFFGFTHCRVVCPRALARLSSLLDRLGPLGDRIQPLYITVDPERDSPDVMRRFLSERAPRFTGLTGSSEQIAAAKAAFRVFAERRADPDDPDGYAVPHTAITYILNPAGECVAHFADALPEEVVLRRLLDLLGATAPASGIEPAPTRLG
jgi:protein SCO1/2